MDKIKEHNKLLYYTKKNSIWFILGLLLLILNCLINISIAHFLKNLTDYALNKNWIQFKTHLYYVLTILLLGCVFKYDEKYLNGKFSSKCVMNLRDNFMKKLIDIRIDSLESLKAGNLLSVFSNDLRKVQLFFQVHLRNIIFRIFMGVGTFIYLFIVNKNVTIAIILIVPIVIIISNYLTKSIEKYALDLQNALGESSTILQDSIRGINIIKSFNLEKKFKKKYTDIINKCIDNGINIDKKVLYMDMAITIFQLLPYIVFSIYGGVLLKNNSITVGELVAFLNLFDNLYMSICEIQYCVIDIRIDIASIKRVINVLNLPIEERLNSKQIESKVNTYKAIIHFNNVSFSYDNKTSILKDISFNVNKGQQVFIVGKSGSGKSTLFKLITKFYTNYTGDIKLFGRNIRQCNIDDLRKQISIVSQDINLFPGTIRENISYGKGKFTLEDIMAAAKKANAHEFIMKLPNGYDSIITEGSTNISGGEKQRIAIARAIIKDAPILLLDEAMSSLDSDSEQKVQLAINNLMSGKTTLIITHKLETINPNDEVIFINQGKIIDKGKHIELTSSNILYKELYEENFRTLQRGKCKL